MSTFNQGSYIFYPKIITIGYFIFTGVRIDYSRVKFTCHEIIEIFESKSIKNLNPLSKHKLIITGGGSKLLSNNYNLSINKIFSELVSYDENDLLVCETGFDYHKSNESFHIKTKKKLKKLGFFENFFNLFSK